MPRQPSVPTAVNCRSRSGPFWHAGNRTAPPGPPCSAGRGTTGRRLAAARLLLQRGVSVRTILVGDWAKMTADAREMARRLQAVGGEIEAFDPDDLEQSAWLGLCDCAIDALLGVGLKRPVQRAFLAAVRRLNSLSCPVVACDLPTGLDGDTGRRPGGSRPGGHDRHLHRRQARAVSGPGPGVLRPGAGHRHRPAQ